MLSFMKYLDPTEDQAFWTEVEERAEQGKNKCVDINELMLEVRADRIMRDFDAQGKEPIRVMINDWNQEYENCEAKPLEFNVLRTEVSAIAEMLINNEYTKERQKPHLCRYSKHYVIDEATGVFMTLLHEIAEKNQSQGEFDGKGCKWNRNLIPIAKMLLRWDPSLVYSTTEGEPLERIPVELALKNYDDEMSSLLLEAMSNKCRVRMLFEHDYSKNSGPRFKFIDFISKPGMEKTVMAVLDSLASPFSTLLPSLEASGFLAAAPQNQYYFRILDGDQNGRKPYNDKSSNDVLFSWNQMSCLQAICMSRYKEAAMRHPVVRLLARRKWNLFGRFHVRVHLAVFLAFLLVMSFALIGSCYQETYRTNLGRLILSGEIFCFLACLTYLGMELDQFCRERKYYFYDVYNYLDILGIASLMLALLLRWSNCHQHLISSFAFIVNFFRLFKFLAAFSASGIYLATISLLFKQNLPVFASVYAIIMVAFSGSLFIANRGEGTATSLPFEDVLLRQIRVITEGQAFAESYSGIGPLATFLILVSTMTSSVILTNLLIAQLSESYSTAKQNAVLQYDIAKLRFAVKIENGRTKGTCLRTKHYQDKTVASNDELL